MPGRYNRRRVRRTLLWMLRDRPLWQGLAPGVGFLHREFTAYGLLAILAVAALDRSRG